jgi:predicted AAA+ superfamily ATPase
VSYREIDCRLAYWRLASGIEVDFVLGDMRLAVEAKSTSNVVSDHLKGLRELARDHPGIGRRVVVCREPKARTTPEGIDVLPVKRFVQDLWDGNLT